MTRDTLFDIDAVSRYHHQAIERGREARRSDALLSATQSIAAWCATALRQEGSADGSHALIPDAALRSSLGSIDGLSPDQEAALLGWLPHYSPEDARPEIDHVWGAGLAAAGIVVMSNPDQFEWTWRTATRCVVAADAFLLELASALGGESKAQMHTTLQRVARDIRALDNCVVLGSDREILTARLAEWRDDADFQRVWDLSQFSVRCEEAWLLEAMLRHDHRRYVGLLEETLNPAVVRDALRAAEEDAGTILDLLAVAPPVYRASPADPTASGRIGNITAPLLLDALINHAQRLIGLLHPTFVSGPPTVEAKALIVQHLPALLQRAIEIVLQRDDGEFLAIQWLVHLAHRSGSTPWTYPPTAATVALQAVAPIMARSGIDERMVRTLLPETIVGVTPGNRQPRVTAVDLFMALVAMHGEQVERAKLMQLRICYATSWENRIRVYVCGGTAVHRIGAMRLQLGCSSAPPTPSTLGLPCGCPLRSNDGDCYIVPTRTIPLPTRPAYS